jgi:anti-sigma factor RsiW
MNDGSPHELSAAYALDALDGDELEAYETHLAGCEQCRGDVASFRATASALAYDVDLPPLPETLEHRIIAAAKAERPNVVPLRQRLALPAAALSGSRPSRRSRSGSGRSTFRARSTIRSRSARTKRR